MSSSRGPLGPVPGMTYDPVRNRYFPTPKQQPSPFPPGPPSLPPFLPTLRGGHMMSTSCSEGSKGKRPWVEASGSTKRATGRLPKSGRSLMRTGPSADEVVAEMEKEYMSNLRLDSSFQCGGCHGENITAIRSFIKGSFYATTDHGKVIVHRTDGETHAIQICGASLFGIHCDIPRMTMMAIAGGPEAHVHHFRRHPDELNHHFMDHSELDLPDGDIFSMSSYDDACSLGGTKWITTVRYTDRLSHQRRPTPSDPLALHHWDSNLLYAGLRNGTVILGDLRVDSRQTNHVGGTRKGKAVVGVKRLKDSAVPWGLLVSGMGDELLIYDVRFPATPLRTLPGHINTYHTNLGMTTTADDKYAIMAGSDNRLRLFSTLTGERIIPDDPHPPAFRGKVGPKEDNPFRRVFRSKIESLCMRDDDLGLDVAVQGELLRFGTFIPPSTGKPRKAKRAAGMPH